MLMRMHMRWALEPVILIEFSLLILASYFVMLFPNALFILLR